MHVKLLMIWKLLSRVDRSCCDIADCITRLTLWRTTRPIETVMFLINITWSIQVLVFGPVFRSAIPQENLAAVLIPISILLPTGLLLDNPYIRKVALFLGALVWLFLFLLSAGYGRWPLLYIVFSVIHSWAYLTLVRYHVK